MFHGLRSLLTPRTSKAERSNRNLEFLGPFLCDDQNHLWLPTPKDLVCRYPKDVGAKKASVGEAARDEHRWEAVHRLQPAPNDPGWAHLAFAQGHPAPMVITKAVYDKAKDQRLGEPQPWIRAKYLADYLEGKEGKESTWDRENLQDSPLFHSDPWDFQVMPHIKMKTGERQVEESDGYFTEVAVRLRPGWHFVARFESPHETLPDQGVIRLGGEGHRALVERMANPDNPHGWSALAELQTHQDNGTRAYVLTPGLALADADKRLYASYPKQWRNDLVGCATDRQLMWGGISAIARGGQTEPDEMAYIPQRAFVPPGTVYVFKSPPKCKTLLPEDESRQWLKTFEMLNYGKLLWGVTE